MSDHYYPPYPCCGGLVFHAGHKSCEEYKAVDKNYDCPRCGEAKAHGSGPWPQLCYLCWGVAELYACLRLCLKKFDQGDPLTLSDRNRCENALGIF